MLEYIAQLDPGLAEVSAAGLFAFFFFATFVSEDAACILAGTAAANGRIGFAAALAACFLGIFVGDLLLYGAGRIAGKRVFENHIVRRFVPLPGQKRASDWLGKNAGTAVFLSRFITGLRLPTYLAAGALRTGFLRFAFWLLLAAALWTPLLVGSVAFAQTTLFSQNALIGFVVLLVIVRIGFKVSSWKNRRLLVGSLKRITNWEFWPLPIFYAPVIAYVLFLAFRHRSLTAFAAANPAFPAGGFKGESKNDIYNAISKIEAANKFVLAHTLIRHSGSLRERLRDAWHFIDQNELSFPMVIKPDAGERGTGVRILHSVDELTDALSGAETDMILQEFAQGKEVSIFYYRLPSEHAGRIFSITEKRFPAVIGDGTSTIEELILAGPRTVAMATRYFECNKERLGRIPARDEGVRLIDIGTHSRGAVFLDGGWLNSDALEAKIDEICRNLNGFYFGRFDIRVPTHIDLQNGERFKIIELNGVTSESTNIYDPRYSLFDAYRILFAQWRLAFEIGTANIRLGAKRTQLRTLAKAAFGFDPKQPDILRIKADTATCV